jgi:hypothetical protein
MAQRRKSSAPDLSGLLVTRPIVRGFSSAAQQYRQSQREQARQEEALLEREHVMGNARRRAREARKQFGRMPNPKTPYTAFGGARVERQG